MKELFILSHKEYIENYKTEILSEEDISTIIENDNYHYFIFNEKENFLSLTFYKGFKDALAVSQLENNFNLNDFINKMKKYGFIIIDSKFTKDYTLSNPLINLQFIKKQNTSILF